MNQPRLRLVLFEARPLQVQQALDAGIDSMIVDWEWRGKAQRQAGVDTEINSDTVADLQVLTDLAVTRRYCRLDRQGRWLEKEVEEACAAGATDLILPMVRRPAEVESFLRRVNGRCRCGIMVETREAVAAGRDLATMGLDFVYVGLNDLAVDRGTSSIFEALIDGTVDKIRESFAEVEFGLGGVTVVDRGDPLPLPILLAELARHRCDFTFARRSYRADTKGRCLVAENAAIQDLWVRLFLRSESENEADRCELICLVKELAG